MSKRKISPSAHGDPDLERGARTRITNCSDTSARSIQTYKPNTTSLTTNIEHHRNLLNWPPAHPRHTQSEQTPFPNVFYSSSPNPLPLSPSPALQTPKATTPFCSPHIRPETPPLHIPTRELRFTYISHAQRTEIPSPASHLDSFLPPPR